ncbi:unnamed protein product [Mytilus edulis]|uniref:PHD-type domain-containing protein n=1 Tax=Mytilus edulis TaxID=6550 RepID=A0A8S3U5Q7_MYTED|nr:unnamed protein product [Mytilus edulis]
MSYPCVLCDQQVRPRQHALQCEDCDKWQHRLCNTGISITDYRLMVNEEVDIIFHCVECVRIPQDMEVEAPEVLEAPPSPAPPSPPPSPPPASPHPAPPSPPPASPQPLDDTLPDHSFDITLEMTYRLQGRLTSLWDQYEEDSIRTSDFLRSVGHLYAPPVPQPETLPESDSEDSDYESD